MPPSPGEAMADQAGENLPLFLEQKLAPGTLCIALVPNFSDLLLVSDDSLGT